MRWILVSGLLLAASCGTDGSPTEPTPTTTPSPTGVSVTYGGERTLFIGNEVQFQATVILSDGSTEATTDVTWMSDALGVATVSPSGLMTAAAAGEATISAEAAGGYGGFLRIRVYPEFQGSWAGGGIATECTATGDSVWSLLCAGFLDGDPAERRGEATLELTQSEAEVGGVVDLGADRRLEVNSGEVSIDGTLRLTFYATTFAIEGRGAGCRGAVLGDAGRHAGKHDRRVSVRLFLGAVDRFRSGRCGVRRGHEDGGRGRLTAPLRGVWFAGGCPASTNS